MNRDKASRWQIYDHLVLSHPWRTLTVLLFLSIALLWNARDFTVDVSADVLLLEDDDELFFYRKTVAEFADHSFLVLTFTPEQNLFARQTLKTVHDIKSRLETLPGVKSVLTILDAPLLNSPRIPLNELSGELPTLETPGIDLQLAHKEFRESPLYSELLLSKDGKTTAFLLFIDTPESYQALFEERESLRELKRNKELDEEQAQTLAILDEEFGRAKKIQTRNEHRLIEKVREIMGIYRKNNRMFLGGAPMISSDIVSFAKNDLLVFGIAAFLLVVITLALIFRQLRWVVLPTACCILSTSLVIGLLGWLDWPGTVVSTNFSELLFIITMSMVIHITVRYQEMLAKKPDVPRWTLTTELVRFMFIPCFYTSVTTLVAFASLLVSGIRPVIDFGWFMVIGLVFGFAIVFSFFPCVLLLLKKRAAAGTNDLTAKLTGTLAVFTKRNRKAILFVAVAIAVMNTIGVSKLEVENRFIDYFKSNTEIHQGMLEIDRQLGGTTPFDLVINKDSAAVTKAATPADEEDDFFLEYESLFDADSKSDYWLRSDNIRRLKEIHEYLESLPQTGKVLSLATLISLAEQAKGGELSPLETAVLVKKLPENIKDILLRPYLSEDGRQLRFNMRIIDSDTQLNRKELIADVKEKISGMVKSEETFRPTGLFVMYNNMLQSLYRSQILTLGGVLGSLLLMFLLLFGSLRLAIIALLPTTLSATFVLGFMGWVGIPLDMMTITIAAISLGIGVDNTIHYVVRFKREFANSKNYQKTIDRCHASVGKAVYYTSLTIIMGFSLLAFSNFLPTIYFGLLVGLSMFTAFLASLTLLPALLATFQPLGLPDKN